MQLPAALGFLLLHVLPKLSSLSHWLLEYLDLPLTNSNAFSFQASFLPVAFSLPVANQYLLLQPFIQEVQTLHPDNEMGTMASQNVSPYLDIMGFEILVPFTP